MATDSPASELGRLRLRDGSVVRLRAATEADLPTLVGLLAADQIGASRETLDGPLPDSYRRALAAIDADPAHLLLVGEHDGDPAHPVVATLQLSVLPGLARRGALRAQIEAVRVSESMRDRGLGTAMLRWAVEEARRRGCALVQLTTDKRRPEAHRLYERLGFLASHEGMKLHLDDSGTRRS